MGLVFFWVLVILVLFFLVLVILGFVFWGFCFWVSSHPEHAESGDLSAPLVAEFLPLRKLTQFGHAAA